MPRQAAGLVGKKRKSQRAHARRAVAALKADQRFLGHKMLDMPTEAMLTFYGGQYKCIVSIYIMLLVIYTYIR